jgi:serine/threonine protein phosphatase Stp1
MRLECVSRTHVGLKRKINEDSVFVDTDRSLWAVADGMGGHDSGEVASAMVCEALANLPSYNNLDECAAGAIEALSDVNARLIDLAQSRESERSIGTTVVGLAIQEEEFRCFWAGDSRAYRVRDGQIARLTRDHSLVQDLVDAGMLSADEAEAHENANVITRAIGVAEAARIDVVSGTVQSGDLFVLGSDGLTRVVRDEELLAVILGEALPEACDRLIQMVLERGAPDNVSLVAVSVA